MICKVYTPYKDYTNENLQTQTFNIKFNPCKIKTIKSKKYYNKDNNSFFYQYDNQYINKKIDNNFILSLLHYSISSVRFIFLSMKGIE